MVTIEEVEELLRPHLLQTRDDGIIRLEVTGSEVAEEGRKIRVALDVSARDEKWRVHLDYRGTDAAITVGKPSPEVVQGLASLIWIHLFEWWHTKDSERKSARMGERLA